MRRFNLFKGKIFYRVFFTYSTIIFIAMAALFALLWQYYSDFLIQKEMYSHEVVIRDVKQDLVRKNEFVRQGVIQLYLERTLIEDLIYALQNDYQEYLHYRLEKFTQSSSFMPYNFDIFVKNYFARDPDVIALTIESEGARTEYSYIFDYNRWHPLSKDPSEMTTLSPFYCVSYPINNPVSVEKIGTIKVFYAYDFFDRYFERMNEPLKGGLQITSREGEVAYQYGKINLKNQIPYGTYTKELRSSGVEFVQSSVEEISGLMVSMVLPKRQIESLSASLFRVMGFTVLLIVLAIILPYYALKSDSKHVESLVMAMKKVESGDRFARAPVQKSETDLNLIARTFNDTLDKLNEYFDKVYMSKLKQTEAELAMLQSKINPHFLYNTLEAIRMKALSEGGKTSAKMIVGLSQLFRMSLRELEWVTLEEELMHVRKYLELFTLRFPEQLIIKINCDESDLAFKTIPFILQPLVENYLIHGFNRSQNSNTISVDVLNEKTHLLIEIKDNGNGIEPKRLLQIQERLMAQKHTEQSIGLYNVNQRIKLKFGSAYGINIESTCKKSTKVSVLLPIVNEVIE